MRLHYLDPGLTGNLGHHANYCRTLCPAFKAKGLEVDVYAHNTLPLSLMDSLGALPRFHIPVYWTTDGDPVSGWLNAFMSSAWVTAEDLNNLDILPEDMVYVNSGQAAQLLAVVTWMEFWRDKTKTSLPSVVFELAIDPGVDVVDIQGKHASLALRDPRVDPRAVLYRYTASRAYLDIRDHLHLCSYSAESAAAYTAILNGWPVATLPCMQPARPRPLRGTNAPTVAFLGHQRYDKGYHLVPEIIRRMRAESAEVRFLIHNGDNAMHDAGLLSIQQEIALMAQEDSRITLDTTEADEAYWQTLLDRSDMVVLPYNPDRFRLSCSAIACECLSQGIPFVCPAGTTLSAMQHVNNSWHGTFAKWDIESIASAAWQMILFLDGATTWAHTAAIKWGQSHGPEKTVDAILALAGVKS